LGWTNPDFADGLRGRKSCTGQSGAGAGSPVRAVRDYGLLVSALYRPQTGYYADLIEECAALWESLSQNHPFVDGNKPTAFASMYTFLVINGRRLDVEADIAWSFVGALYAENQLTFANLVPWLRERIVGDRNG
jgi:death-on-curing protein